MTPRFKVLAADKLAEEGLAYLRAQADVELTVKPGLNEEQLAQIVGEYDGMIVRSGVQVTAKVLAQPGRLKVVARAGVGVDNIDVDAATAAGILVMNSAEASTITTAEHAFALMMALSRNIGQAHETMHAGGWDRNRFQGHPLAGRTLGVVGFGRIGQTVASRALAFDMQVLAYDPFYNAATAMDGRVKLFSQFTELLPHADILTFHVPLNAQTRHMLSAETFKLCRKGVMLVNAARGGIIDEAALAAAIESGQCAGAALDVFETEPLPPDSPLRRQSGLLLTPHLGASTVEAQEAVSIDASVSLLEFLRGESVRGAVNVTGLRLDLEPQQARYVDLAKRMAMLLGPMIAEGIAQVTVQVAGESLQNVATTIERMALIGLLQPHLATRLNLVNVRHAAEQRGITLRTLTGDNEKRLGTYIAIEVHGGERTHRIVGRVYDDMRPRVVEINGYHMDIVPAGHMVMIRNEDRPGMIGLVGTEFGQSQVNIADMAISRRGDSALMLLRVDSEPPVSLVNRLLSRPGILKIALVRLPELGASSSADQKSV